MPEQFPLWMAAIPFLLWVIVRFSHEEAMKYTCAARLVFDRPTISYQVPLYNRKTELVAHKINGQPVVLSQPKSDFVAYNDICKFVVRNQPRDLLNGRPVVDAWVRVTIHDSFSGNLVCEIEHPRWGENPKTGYEGKPSDHFPDEWKYRTLRPDMSRNTIDFMLKSIDEDDAYGFPGTSQRLNNWKDKELSVPPGEYIVCVEVTGAGLRKSAETRLLLLNPGSSKSLTVKKAPEKLWKGRGFNFVTR